MEITDIVKLATESGMGVLSFAALIYGGVKLLAWLEDVKNNHLFHIQTSLNKLTENSTDANVKLDQQTSKLDELLRK